jgi:hypothetical protein
MGGAYITCNTMELNMTTIKRMRDLVRHGPNSGLSPKQLERVKLALKRLETKELKKVA